MFRYLSLLLFSSALSAQNLVPKIEVLRQKEQQSDFPSLCVDPKGQPWIAYVQWDGKQDTLQVAQQKAGALESVLTLGQAGIIHQPAIACDGVGTLHVIWSQVNDQNVMELHAGQIRDGKVEIMKLASSVNGGNVFAKAACDTAGKVWVVWQGMRGAQGDIFCRVYDPAQKDWSNEIQVTHDAAGDWEPCVAFDAQKGAWVLYDSSRGNEFNVYGTRIQADLKVGETKTLIATDRYEGRVSAVGTKDGSGI
jgi:beta-xylosidase